MIVVCVAALRVVLKQTECQVCKDNGIEYYDQEILINIQTQTIKWQCNNDGIGDGEVTTDKLATAILYYLARACN